MKSCRKELWFNLPARRGFVNVTPININTHFEQFEIAPLCFKVGVFYTGRNILSKFNQFLDSAMAQSRYAYFNLQVIPMILFTGVMLLN